MTDGLPALSDSSAVVSAIVAVVVELSAGACPTCTVHAVATVMQTWIQTNKDTIEYRIVARCLDRWPDDEQTNNRHYDVSESVRSVPVGQRDRSDT